jgi:hypothetical protein
VCASPWIEGIRNGASLSLVEFRLMLWLLM